MTTQSLTKQKKKETTEDIFIKFLKESSKMIRKARRDTRKKYPKLFK